MVQKSISLVVGSVMVLVVIILANVQKLVIVIKRVRWEMVLQELTHVFGVIGVHLVAQHPQMRRIR